MRSGRLHRYGEQGSGYPEPSLLEQDYAAYVGSKYCVAVSSCGAAMFIALKALGYADDHPQVVRAERELKRLEHETEDSVRIGGTADEVVVSLLSEQNAVLVYRFRWDGARWQRGPRTLVSPALVQTPYLPIGASYDNFDAVVNAFSARLAVASGDGVGGAAYVALTAADSRLRRHNAVFGTRQ